MGTCEKQGITLDRDLAEKVHKQYRNVFSKVPAFWRACEKAFYEVITSTKNTLTVSAGRVAFVKFKPKFYGIVLPSGRRLIYFNVHIKDNQIYYCKFRRMKSTDSGDRFVRINEQWFYLDNLYGGKIVENITQAVARDIFFFACHQLFYQGYSIVARIHDEVLSEVNPKKMPDFLEKGIKIMETETEDWAKTIPLKVEAWHGDFYHK